MDIKQTYKNLARGMRKSSRAHGLALVGKGVRSLLALCMLSSLMVIAPLQPVSAYASGGVYYVSTAGSDSTGNGSSTAPWATIQKAANTIAGGDTVHVAAGSYNERVTIASAKSGSASVPTVFVADGAVVVTQGLVVQSSYTNLTGFEVYPGSSSISDNSASGQVSVSGSHNMFGALAVHGVSTASPAKGTGIYVTGSYNTFASPSVACVNQAGIWLHSASYNTFNDADVSDYGGLSGIGSDWDYPGTDNTWARPKVHGLSGFNMASGNDGDGFTAYSPNTSVDGALIQVKQHYDPRSVPTGTSKHTDNFVFDQNMNGLVVRNSTIGNMDLSQTFNGSTGNTCVEGALQNSAYTFHFYNDVFLCPDAGGSSTTNPADNPWIVGGQSSTGSTIYNCLFYGKYSGFPSGVKVRNCIFILTPDSPQYTKAPSSDTDYCLVVGPSMGSGWGAHSKRVSANDLIKWVNPSTTSATGYGVNADWHPAADSPLVGAGIGPSADSAVYPTDMSGVARTGATTDIGPLVHGGAPATTYTLTYTANAGGTISGTSPQSVTSGGSGTAVSAVANTGYHFVNWSDGVTTATRTDTNVTASKSVAATFAANTTTYTLTYTANAGGTISGTSPQSVTSGGSGTAVSAVANTGYHFVNWSDGVTTATRTDTNVTASKSVAATFAANTTTYTLTYTANAGGTISGTSPQSVTSGGSGTAVSAVANTGYHFVNWSDGVTTATRTDTNVTASKSVAATFAANTTTYTLTYTANAGGTISGTSPQSVTSGGSGTAVSAVANTGYHFVNWSDGVTTATRTDTNVTASKSVAATFAANTTTYTLTYTANAGGTISGTSPQSVTSGGSGTAVSAVANTGYHFVNWSDGVTTATRTDTNVTASKSVAAVFANAQNQLALTFTPGAQTLVVPSGVTSISVTLQGGAGGDDSANGGGTGGRGGRAVAVVPVTPGTVLSIRTGGRGRDGSPNSAGLGGWPNGGSGDLAGDYSAGGGGSTTIWAGSVLLAEAGGGGGGGDNNVGTDGGAQGSGTQDATHGFQAGGIGASSTNGGGGGGGWNPGLGSGGWDNGSEATGGTSRIAVGTGSLTSGVNGGDGSATIKW